MGTVGVVLVIALATSLAVAAPAPDLADIHARIDRIVALLQEPGLTHEQRRQAVLAAADPAFDWRGMARAALGPAWRERTPAGREKFTRLFQALVERHLPDAGPSLPRREGGLRAGDRAP